MPGILGYRVETVDGTAGRLADVLGSAATSDGAGAGILVVEPHQAGTGRRAVPGSFVDGIDANTGVVRLCCHRDEVLSAPEVATPTADLGALLDDVVAHYFDRGRNVETHPDENQHAGQPPDAPPRDEGATLADVLDRYEAAGYTAGFTVLADARLQCGACGEAVAADSVEIASLRRLEGASDPDDMIAVVALTCPHCARRGTVTLGYGPAASPDDGDVLRAFRDRRGTSSLPPNSAPGETTGDG